jgi:catechol 2,3-dioxygenase-like lactoylglutathione lyase family enzyme
MLRSADVQPMLPVKDLSQAQKFYDETLGLKRVHDVPGQVVTYRSGNTTLNLYRSDYAGTNQGTAAVWEVEDLEGTVQELKKKGISFEHYDLKGLQRQGDIHRSGEFGVAWFKDPAGNILSIQSKVKGGKLA